MNGKYTATEEIIKTGKTVREVVRYIDPAWIPGLNKLMADTPVKSMDLELHVNVEEDGVDKRFYRIVKNF